MSEAKAYLYNLVRDWEDKAAKSSSDYYPYVGTLNEILYQAELRFSSYLQFKDLEGEFPVRLKNWLNNLSDEREKQALFKLIPLILFIDRSQTLSLCRDAYRRIIVPWLTSHAFHPEDMLSNYYESKTRNLLREYPLYSITESFYFSDFLNVNSLAGLAKPIIFGEDTAKVKFALPQMDKSIKGLIIFEDMVGTGKQAGNIIEEVRRLIPPEWRLLFVPLVILEEGLENLNVIADKINVTIEPVLVISKVSCIKEISFPMEPPEFSYIRTVIQKTSVRVLQPSDSHDDPPNNAFGYKGCGALIVIYRNTPNNTLPLIHHRAPDWIPLFRRLHHKKI